MTVNKLRLTENYQIVDLSDQSKTPLLVLKQMELSKNELSFVKLKIIGIQMNNPASLNYKVNGFIITL